MTTSHDAVPPRRSTSRGDRAVTELAERMLAVLQSHREQGGSGASYPIPLEMLGRKADPQAGSPRILKAAAKRCFATRAVAARIRLLDAPVALAEDLELLAASPLTLQLALRVKRTAKTHLHTVAQLAQKLTGKLQQPFKQTVGRQVEAERLPPGVGWIWDRRPKLFLMEDVHSKSLGRPAIVAETGVAGQVEPAASPADFAACFEAAFDELDRRKGSHNFVSLVELRRRLADFPRARFDAGLRELRLAGRYSLSAAESIHGIQPEQRQAGIEEAGTLLLFASRKTP